MKTTTINVSKVPKEWIDKLIPMLNIVVLFTTVGFEPKEALKATITLLDRTITKK